MNLTMKNAFLLLALFAGTVRGSHLDAEVQGYKEDGNYCSPTVYDELYGECVVGTAMDLGVVFDRRLELRGSGRDLFSCAVCPPNPPRGHFCWVMCGRGYRRLTLAANERDADRRLVTQEDIQAAATACYVARAGELPCLGSAEEIQVNIEYDGK